MKLDGHKSLIPKEAISVGCNAWSQRKKKSGSKLPHSKMSRSDTWTLVYHKAFVVKGNLRGWRVGL